MVGRLFSLITGILGLASSVITIGVFFFTAPPSPNSSSYIVEDVVISFVLFYGWIALSAALIQRTNVKVVQRRALKCAADLAPVVSAVARSSVKEPE